MRWFGLACFLILLLMAWRKGDMKNYAIAFSLGCALGFAIDGVGIPLGLWEFPRQPFLSLEYFLVVVPCWGVFGATINMIKDWYIKSSIVGLILLTIAMRTIYEVPNLMTGSWVYTTSSLLVNLGWIPLIIAYRLSFLLTNRRLVGMRRRI